VAIDTVEVQQVGALTVNAGQDQVICAGNLTPLNGSGNGDFSWSPDTLVSNPSIANPIFTGDADAQLVLTVSQGNCMVQDTLNLIVLESPDATAQPADSTLLPGASVQLTGTGIGTIVWSPAEGLSCVNCLNPIATPDSTTTYILSITNDLGCTDTAQVLLRVTPPDCEPDIPNAFTPNGDGANDRFQPIGKSIESYDLTIYTRWGQKIYQGKTPWDGRGYGLIDASSDVYIYRVNIQVCGEIKPFSGEVSLLR
jgi:gliding motility-associated-like protein